MFLRRYILLLLTLLSFTLQAQQYPVDVQVFVTPPYPQSLRGYADTFEQKIQAHFLLKDLSTGGRPFVLRFSLEDFQGQVIAQTPDYITPYLVNLSPGVRRTLTNIDFKTLLRYENLYGINEATYNGLLPEGSYFFGLSLYDVATGRPVSNKGRAMIQVRRYSPPVLTMPQKGEVLTKKNAFQHIVFQWMPRDIAPFMQYEFTLKEVWDLALVPEEAFMTGRLVYQTKTFSPALAYTNMMPILLENKRYVWQVRAFTNNPNNPNEQSYFKNNGNSETFYFDLVSHCEAPKFLTAITESTSAQLRWSAQAMMSNQEYPYKVMYRERGKTWKSQKVSMPYAKVTGLKRGRTYIYKVGVACGLETAYSSSVFGEESYMYSTEQEFTTTEQIDEKSQVQCGVKPEIRIKNTEPLQDNLYANTTFTAGDFPVTVLNATGSNGVYSGEGYVKVPYLQDTKIKVVFNGIKLNTERQLIEGKLVTTYDETERNVVEIKSLSGVINDVKNIFKKKKLTEEDVKSLQELKKQWDFYLSNTDEIGISEEDKTAFKEIGAKMFSASTGKLSKEEKETLITNTEKAEKLYDKYKNKFEEYTTKKEEEANNESSIFLDVSLEKVDVTETNFTSDSPPPPIGNGEYIGQIKLGSGEDKDNYVWNGEIWSKVIDNKDGSYSAFIYGKNNSRYFLVATWKKSDNFSTIETKVLRAKNGANLAGVYMDNWDIMTFPLEAPVAIYQFNYNNLATTARYKNIRRSNNINKNMLATESKLIYAENYIKGNKFVEGVRKIDLMGGKVSQLGDDFVNVDIIAEKGIRGSATDLSKFIRPNSIDEIVCSNPQAEFIEQASKILKKNGKIYINGTEKNTFFSSITHKRLKDLKLNVISEKQPLNEKFKHLNFYFSDGVRKIPNTSMRTTILQKK